MAATGASKEWRHYPMLPIAAALGYATSVIHIYGFNPYVLPISEAFGWTRTQVTVGLTIATLIQAIFSIPIGILVDRVGPRRLGLLGIVLTATAFAMLGTATGEKGNWYLLWGLMAVATLPVQATIWTSAVATRFDASRGLAFAVTLCGASVAIAVFPYLGTKLIAAYGWKNAFAIQAGIWLTIAFPMLLFFFRGANDQTRETGQPQMPDKATLPGVSISEGLRSTIYVRLLLASLLFTFTIVALAFHFGLILTGRGVDKLKAAELAALIGLFSIIGRLGTGFLLDRFRGSLVGAAAFLLPVIACLLLISTGTNPSAAAIAAATIGLTLGSEIDVIVFLVTKHFGLRNFGALYGGLLAALSVGTATGPLAASKVFDSYGDYAPFLWLTVGFMIVSSLALASLPRPAFDIPGA